MKQINIVSNTTNERVGLYKEDILFLKDFYLSRISNETSIVELDKSDMTLLKEEIEKLTDQKLSVRTDILNPNVKLVYKEVEYNLDFRNHNDFLIGTLISIYLIADSTIKLSGIISIYSPDTLLEHNKSGAVLAFIRGKYSVSASDLPEELIRLYQNNPHGKDLNANTIAVAINYLEKLGLIWYDRILKQYSVTAKGYNL